MRIVSPTARVSRRTALTLATTAAGAVALSRTANADAASLYAQIGAIDQQTSGTLSVCLFDNRSHNLMTYNPGMRNETASIIKPLILGTVCLRAQTAGRGLTSWEKQVATTMIRFSDNDSATALWNNVGGVSAVSAFARRIGMTQTVPNRTWGLTMTSAYDQILLMNEYCWNNKVLATAHRTFIINLMGSVTPSQRWGVGSYGLNHVKNGWLPYAGSWRINSIGHVGGAGTRNYTLAILQKAPSETAGIATANRVALTCYNALATSL